MTSYASDWVIDADAHVFEPLDMWRRFLDPAYQGFAPSPQMTIQGKPIYYKATPEILSHWTDQIMLSHPLARIEGFTPELHIAEMQRMGVDVAYVYPTVGLSILGMDAMDPPLAHAFAQAYNQWLYQEYCSYNPERLKAVGVVSLHHPTDALKELYRLVSWGWNVICIRPNPVKGRILSDPVYEDFWAACVEMNVAVAIHEGTHSQSPTAGADRFHTRFALRACSHVMEQMMALLALIEGGVLERHPTLKVAFLEAGSSWLLHWLWRLDEEYECHAWEVQKTVKMKPSEYFRRQCFVGCEFTEPYLEQVIDYVGADRLLFGSDYPHVHWGVNEDQEPIPFQVKKTLEERLSPALAHQILCQNPCSFYGC